jgi:hypothetical protein
VMDWDERQSEAIPVVASPRDYPVLRSRQGDHLDVGLSGQASDELYTDTLAD